MVELAPEITKLEADELLEQIAEYKAKIKTAEDERDEFVQHYQAKIQNAYDICERTTVPARHEIAILTETLGRYAAANLPEGRKSIALPSGTLSFHKQFPKFFIDGREVNGNSKALLEYVKVNAPEFVKITECVDWSDFKKKLAADDENVYYAETGEIIQGLQMQTYPDTFKIEIK